MENNKLTNLTININSQHIQHDEVGTHEIIQSKTIFGYRVSIYNYLNLEIA